MTTQPTKSQIADSCDGASGLSPLELPSPLLANLTGAFFCTAFFNAFLTAAKELFPPLKEALVGVFGHHWVGHGVLVFLVYAILFVGFYLIGMNKILKVGNACCQRHTAIGAAAGVLLIFGFYVFFGD